MSNTDFTRKKLIEVALPLMAINAGCEEDKNRKTGHIRNLHKWFAPMPLPAWRAMLFAAIVDDPSETVAPEAVEAERERLFRLIERLSAFDAYRDLQLLKECRDEILRSTDGKPPTVIDPFCGGGSTLLEAQRLGMPTLASDLNPIPVLITTVLCRVAPLFGHIQPVSPRAEQDMGAHWAPLRGLIADVNYYARSVRERAWRRLQSHYPLVTPEQATPYAYRWAWSVASPDPSAAGRHTPLVSDWWLSKQKDRSAWINPYVDSRGQFSFSVEHDGTPPPGTTGRSAARCLLTGTPIPVGYIRAEGRAGRLRQNLMAVASRSGNGAVFTAPDAAQVAAATELPRLGDEGIEMPPAALGFRVQQYGITNFLDLFTPRQATALKVFTEEISLVHADVLAAALRSGFPDDDRPLEEEGTGARAYADAICAILALCVSKLAQSNNVLVRWFVDPRNGSGKATPAFDRHAVPMVWDFVETNPFGGSVGDWTGPVLETALRAFELTVSDGIPTHVSQGDARRSADTVPDNSLVASDPPYYANIGYADLSDFFYLWLRQAARPWFPKLFGTVSAPKGGELIASPFRHANGDEANDYFRQGFKEAFGGLGRRSDPRYPLLIVYSLKQTEESNGGATGWEVFLDGLIDAGLQIVATWPVRTTTSTRMIGLGNNALASAIFVIARQRSEAASAATRLDLAAALRRELPGALRTLQQANVAPVDLQQAVLGPGMAVFTRYAKVLDASGETMNVRDALALINQVLDEALAEQEGDFDPDSRWALAWYTEHGFADGPFGEAHTYFLRFNTSESGLKAAGIVASGGGKVRLLRPAELPADWEPTNDRRLTAWESVHQLVRALESGGESEASVLAGKLGSHAETARELCYRLYTLCERKKRASEALSYNGVVQSWPEIRRLAQDLARQAPQQPALI